jgi:hypothetical protein
MRSLFWMKLLLVFNWLSPHLWIKSPIHSSIKLPNPCWKRRANVIIQCHAKSKPWSCGQKIEGTGKGIPHGQHAARFHMSRSTQPNHPSPVTLQKIAEDSQRANDLAQLPISPICSPETTYTRDTGGDATRGTNLWRDELSLRNRHKQSVYALKCDQMKGFDYLHPQGFYDAITVYGLPPENHWAGQGSPERYDTTTPCVNW